MASWLDAFVQGREQGLRTSLGGLEAGTAAQRGFETEIGTRKRAEQDARLSSADMALRRNIAQSELNYNAQVDRANIENQKQRLELDAAKHAAEQALIARNQPLHDIQLREAQRIQAENDSLRNLRLGFYDDSVGPLSIIEASALIPLEAREKIMPELREAVFRKMHGMVKRGPMGAYQFVPNAFDPSLLETRIGQGVSRNRLESLLRSVGIETATMYPGTETRSNSESGGFLSQLRQMFE